MTMRLRHLAFGAITLVAFMAPADAKEFCRPPNLAVSSQQVASLSAAADGICPELSAGTPDNAQLCNCLIRLKAVLPSMDRDHAVKARLALTIAGLSGFSLDPRTALVMPIAFGQIILRSAAVGVLTLIGSLIFLSLLFRRMRRYPAVVQADMRIVTTYEEAERHVPTTTKGPADVAPAHAERVATLPVAEREESVSQEAAVAALDATARSSDAEVPQPNVSEHEHPIAEAWVEATGRAMPADAEFQAEMSTADGVNAARPISVDAPEEPALGPVLGDAGDSAVGEPKPSAAAREREQDAIEVSAVLAPVEEMQPIEIRANQPAAEPRTAADEAPATSSHNLEERAAISDGAERPAHNSESTPAVGHTELASAKLDRDAEPATTANDNARAATKAEAEARPPLRMRKRPTFDPSRDDRFALLLALYKAYELSDANAAATDAREASADCGATLDEISEAWRAVAKPIAQMILARSGWQRPMSSSGLWQALAEEFGGIPVWNSDNNRFSSECMTPDGVIGSDSDKRLAIVLAPGLQSLQGFVRVTAIPSNKAIGR